METEKGRNRDWFAGKVLEAEQSMYRIAKSILFRDEDCGDAMQNAILRAYEHLPSLKEESSFKSWLIHILVNECYQILRQRKRAEGREERLEWEQTKGQEERLTGKAGEVGEIPRSLEYSELYQAIRNLKEKYRIPFVLFYVEGFSVREISEMMEISESAVKTRLHRGRKLLQEDLKGVYGYGTV